MHKAQRCDTNGISFKRAVLQQCVFKNQFGEFIKHLSDTANTNKKVMQVYINLLDNIRKI